MKAKRTCPKSSPGPWGAGARLYEARLDRPTLKEIYAAWLEGGRRKVKESHGTADETPTDGSFWQPGRTSPRRSPERSPQSQPLDREPQRREPEKKFDLRRLFSSAEIVLVGKDLGAIWRNKGTRALLMLLPVTLIVLLPLVYSVAISFLPTEDSLALPQDIAAMVGNLEGYGPRRQWMAAFTTLLCPMLFLCVPIVCSVTAAARVFVGRRRAAPWRR